MCYDPLRFILCFSDLFTLSFLLSLGLLWEIMSFHFISVIIPHSSFHYLLKSAASFLSVLATHYHVTYIHFCALSCLLSVILICSLPLLSLPHHQPSFLDSQFLSLGLSFVVSQLLSVHVCPTSVTHFTTSFVHANLSQTFAYSLESLTVSHHRESLICSQSHQSSSLSCLGL